MFTPVLRASFCVIASRIMLNLRGTLMRDDDMSMNGISVQISNIRIKKMDEVEEGSVDSV